MEAEAVILFEGAAVVKPVVGPVDEVDVVSLLLLFCAGERIGE